MNYQLHKMKYPTLTLLFHIDPPNMEDTLEWACRVIRGMRSLYLLPSFSL